MTEVVQRSRLLAPLAVLLPAWAVSPGAWGQEAWPTRPVRMVVPFPPGGSSDILGRLVADRLGRALEASFVVENKAGATTQIGTEHVAAAPPDGYTLLLGAASSFTVLPNLRKLGYSLDSFEAIGGVADYVAVMAVRKSLPVTSVREFIDHAKKNPGKLSFGSAGEASAGHVYGATLARDAGIELLHVPFRGSADAANALVAGEVDFVIDGAITPMVKAERVRPLATFYQARHPELPQVPTLAEEGLRIESSRGSGWGVLAPKGTPAPVVAKLSGALRSVLTQKEVQDALVRANSIAAWQPPQAFRTALAADERMYAQLLPAIGVRRN
ncbi:tripartite tricarboxylate transporter substrate binding protein [Xenophilus arseniciresistens]|uniref:Tripartite tricarboxylate transporter substrate binding protein n=1 Tax=Xenophilus arseniciresistens TaxID=1283306 RepID=A0AAE3N809_9BURK|nr:tripartite tricarboxylate transporter substrate binding protein [Xenophilus arseniciresistens]MDA7416051.1 tripartite tricarboxylate transporter substrate binding protein [Xenophilus arseniciresistens]